MRNHGTFTRTAAAVLGVATVAAPYATAVAQAAGTTTKAVTRKAKGTSEQADRWGDVQVTVTEKVTASGSKKTIKFTDLGGTYSYHTSRSSYIMSQALPLLRQEFLAAQSAKIQMISGATDTSEAFEQSLQSALSRLGK